MIILERMKIIDQLRNTDSFTPTEKAIVKYLEENGQSVVKMNLDQLSKTLYVSKSSIIRLCKKLGFKGHKELCVQLAKELESFIYDDEILNPSNPYHPSDSAKVVAGKTSQIFKGALSDTVSQMDIHEIEELANQILKTGKLYIYSSEECTPLAEILFGNLSAIGIHVEMQRNYISPCILANTQPKDSCAVFITYSLFSQELKKCGERLQDLKIPLYLICSAEKGVVPFNAEHMIRIQYYEPFPKVCNVGSRVAIMYILDVIYGIVFYKDYDKHQKIVEELELSMR